MAAKKKAKAIAVLPGTPSLLIRMALKDLTAAEKVKAYKIDMGSWHEPLLDPRNDQPNGKCAICFGGAVMARTLKTPLTLDKTPDMFDEYTTQKLYALDSFRLGNTYDAMRHLGYDMTVAAEYIDRIDIEVPSYSPINHGKAFKAAMNKMADAFEKIGL